MNATDLLVHFEKIADAPDSMQRLRRLVLDLAIRGKLVSQNPKDEPASELLKRIAAEKERLVGLGQIKQPKPLPEITQPPFDLPPLWRWARIREITSDRGQAVPDRPFTYIDVTSIDKENGVVANPKVLTASEAPSRARKITEKGDVIYSCVRPYLLNVAVITEDIKPPPIASTAFAILNGFGFVAPRYIWIVLRSPFLVSCVEATQRGQAYPAINDADFAVLPFPLPPLAEQHRIIAKVDELMVLCDQIEASRTERESRLDRLTASSFARLSTPEPDAFQHAARFALNFLPSLTARTDQIRLLRQTILDLALRGELSPRNLENRGMLVRDGDQKKTGIDEPFALPNGWKWFELGDIAAFENGDRSKNYPNRSEYVENGVAWINTGHIRPDGSLSSVTMNYITKSKFASLGGGKIKPGDLVYCLRGATFGKTAFVEPFTQGAIASSLMIIRPGPLLDRRFAYSYLISPLGRTQLMRFDNGTAQPNLASGNVKRYLVPLPPLAEQHSIVTKVDRLMSLCDRLEASLTARDEYRSCLLAAILNEGLRPAEERDKAA